jgi:hypothetical protein
MFGLRGDQFQTMLWTASRKFHLAKIWAGQAGGGLEIFKILAHPEIFVRQIDADKKSGKR